MNEFQVYAVDASGKVVHAGCVKAARITGEWCRKDQQKWEEDTARLADEVPDCPRSQDWLAGNSVVEKYIVWPVGEPQNRKEYLVGAAYDEKRRAKGRSYSRARHTALASCGMKRTKYGYE